MKRSLDVAATVLTALLLLAFAALSLRGLIAPEQASARFGAPVADAAGSLFYRVYLSRNLVITVTGAIFLAHATMGTARRSSDCDGGLAGVRHDGAVFERRDPAGLSPACVGADRNHRRAGVATGGRRQGLVYARSKGASRKIAIRLRPKTAAKSRSSRFWWQPAARLARFWALVFRSNRRKTRGFPS
jgi:hypothetical protein